MDTRTANTPCAVALALLSDAEAGWSIKTHGAVCEFSCVGDDLAPTVAVKANGGEIVTKRGAMRFALPEETRAVAFECLGNRARSWTQTIAFCLQHRSSTLSGRTRLTELGFDADAVRSADRESVLFDIGVGAPHVEFCVRTAEPSLLRILRRSAGKNALADAPEALDAIKEISPHRVCRTAAARIEVFQPMPSGSAEGGGALDPHSDLVPELLADRRLHPNDTAIPDGWAPVLTAHPPSPVPRAGAGAGEFDHHRYTAFQKLLERLAPVGYLEEKLLITSSVMAGMDPAHFPPPDHRSARLAVRVALRQLCFARPDAPRLEEWLAKWDEEEAFRDQLR